MKKVLKPSIEEDVVYYSDFSGKLINSTIQTPPCELNLEFNYGSKYDGEKITFHLTDDEVEEVLIFLKAKLTEESRAELNKVLPNLRGGDENG